MKALRDKLSGLLESEGEALLRAAIEKGRSGDVSALRLALDRLMPTARESCIKVELPPVESVSDVPRVIGMIVARVANGELTPSEGATVVGMLSAMRAAFEAIDLAARISAIELALPGNVGSGAASGTGGIN
jgi:translation elongation factor EF-Tu-like GTPase